LAFLVVDGSGNHGVLGLKRFGAGLTTVLADKMAIVLIDVAKVAEYQRYLHCLD
jgi:hypothetical protein